MLPKDYDTIHGWCTREKAVTMMNIVFQSKPSLTVELGVFGGKSLLALALASKQVNPTSKVIGIDAWTAQASLEGTNAKENDDWWSKVDYPGMYEYTKNLMNQNSVGSIVDLWKCKSNECINKFEDNSIDILHQDSNHSEEISCEEVELYWNKLKTGGHWIFDDTNWATTQEAQKLLVTKGFEEIYSASNNEWKIFKKMH
jgi:cephalosporin hydroxylase